MLFQKVQMFNFGEICKRVGQNVLIEPMSVVLLVQQKHLSIGSGAPDDLFDLLLLAVEGSLLHSVNGREHF